MGDAVIVSAARTADRHGPQGLARRLRRVRPRPSLAVGEALKRSGVPVGRRRRPRARRVAPGRRRHRPLRRGRARPDRRPRPRAQPPLRVGPGVGADRGRQHPRRHGPVVIAGGTETITQSPQRLQEAPRLVLGRPAVAVAAATPRRPTRRRWTCRSRSAGTPRRRPNVTREEQDHWAYHSHQRAVAAIDEGRLKDEIFASRCPVPGSGETRIFDTDEHPRRDTTMEKLASLPALHPEIHGFIDHRGQLVGAQRRRRARWSSPTRRLRRRPRARADGDRAVVGVGRRAARPTPGLGPTLAIPKALERAGLDDRRRRPRRDQRGVRVDGGRVAAASSASTTRS